MEYGSAPLAQDYIFQGDTKGWSVGEQGYVCDLSGEMTPKLDKLPSYSLGALDLHLLSLM